MAINMQIGEIGVVLLLQLNKERLKYAVAIFYQELSNI